MSTIKKMTKREKFTALLSLLESYESDSPIVEGFSVEDATAFLSHEVELLDKKNAVKGEKKPTEKQKQNAEIGEMVVDLLNDTDGGLTITQMLKTLDGLPADMTNQRMTHIVTALVNAERVERYTEKRVTYFKAK